MDKLQGLKRDGKKPGSYVVEAAYTGQGGKKARTQKRGLCGLDLFAREQFRDRSSRRGVSQLRSFHAADL